MSKITIIEGNSNDKDNIRTYMVKGEPGDSPTANVTKSGDTATITITDYNGTTTAEVVDGTDGVSPTASVSKVGKVTTLTVTDGSGTTTSTINDGEDGATYEVPTGSVVGYEGSTVPGGYEEVDNPFNYSTTETKIGTWIDGKPLYRKVLTVPTLPNNSDMYVNYDNTFNVMKFDIYIEDTTAGYKFKLPIVSSTSSNVVGCYILTQTHQIGIRTFSDRTGYTSNYAIIEYTKTTD